MMKRWILYLLIAIGVTALAAEVVLPRAVAALVAHSLSRMTGDSQVSVTTENTPAIQMLAGRFGLLAVEGDEVKIDKLTFSRVTIRLEQAEMDIAALYTRRTLVLKSAADIDLMAVVSQEELARFLNRDVKGVQNATVTITPDKAIVNGEVSLAGLTRANVNLEGRIVADGQQIKFVTQRLGVTRSVLGDIFGSATTALVLADFNKAPFPVNLRQVVMEAGKVTVRADSHRQ